MIEIKKASDYYPVFLDLNDPDPGSEVKPLATLNSFLANSAALDNPELINMDELIRRGIKSNYTPFQCMVLLVKNAMEGHAFMFHGLLPAELMEKGTILLGNDTETCNVLPLDFYDNFFAIYADGIRRGMAMIAREFNIHEEISLDALICFILGNQLQKFPVSALDIFDHSAFFTSRNNTPREENFFYKISGIVQQVIGEIFLIETVNDLYEAKFKEMIHGIVSREQVLARVSAKLVMANDPAIRTEQDLEKTYFDYIVTAAMNPELRKGTIRVLSFLFNSPKMTPPGNLGAKIKSLYRSISKNCRETHTVTEQELRHPFLDQSFMDASLIYNDHALNKMDPFVQYFSLIDILARIVNYRKTENLPVVFSDFTAMSNDSFNQSLTDEDVQNIKTQFDKKVTGLRQVNFTESKAKHVRDEDLGKVHHDYLQLQIDYLDEQIREILAKIKNIMYDKGIKPSS